MVRRVAAIAPFGLVRRNRSANRSWAQRARPCAGPVVSADPEIWKAMNSLPEGANSIEWPIEQTRAAEAAARILSGPWVTMPRIEKRLRLITAPVLLLWGENDRIMPRSYAATFAGAISGKTETKIISGAGHLAELDKPAEVAKAILDFTA